MLVQVKYLVPYYYYIKFVFGASQDPLPAVAVGFKWSRHNLLPVVCGFSQNSKQGNQFIWKEQPAFIFSETNSCLFHILSVFISFFVGKTLFCPMWSHWEHSIRQLTGQNKPTRSTHRFISYPGYHHNTCLHIQLIHTVYMTHMGQFL